MGVIPANKLMAVRKDDALTSELFKVPGVAPQLQLSFWPKGQLTGKKGRSAIGCNVGSGVQEVDTRVRFTCTETVAPCASMQEENDYVIEDFCKSPTTTVTITVRRP